MRTGSNPHAKTVFRGRYTIAVVLILLGILLAATTTVLATGLDPGVANYTVSLTESKNPDRITQNLAFKPAGAGANQFWSGTRPFLQLNLKISGNVPMLQKPRIVIKYSKAHAYQTRELDKSMGVESITPSETATEFLTTFNMVALPAGTDLGIPLRIPFKPYVFKDMDQVPISLDLYDGDVLKVSSISPITMRAESHPTFNKQGLSGQNDGDVKVNSTQADLTDPANPKFLTGDQAVLYSYNLSVMFGPATGQTDPNIGVDASLKFKLVEKLPTQAVFVPNAYFSQADYDSNTHSVSKIINTRDLQPLDRFYSFYISVRFPGQALSIKPTNTAEFYLLDTTGQAIPGSVRSVTVQDGFILKPQAVFVDDLRINKTIVRTFPEPTYKKWPLDPDREAHWRISIMNGGTWQDYSDVTEEQAAEIHKVKVSQVIDTRLDPDMIYTSFTLSDPSTVSNDGGLTNYISKVDPAKLQKNKLYGFTFQNLPVSGNLDPTHGQLIAEDIQIGQDIAIPPQYRQLLLVFKEDVELIYRHNKVLMPGKIEIDGFNVDVKAKFDPAVWEKAGNAYRNYQVGPVLSPKGILANDGDTQEHFYPVGIITGSVDATKNRELYMLNGDDNVGNNFTSNRNHVSTKYRFEGPDQVPGELKRKDFSGDFFLVDYSEMTARLYSYPVSPSMTSPPTISNLRDSHYILARLYLSTAEDNAGRFKNPRIIMMVPKGFDVMECSAGVAKGRESGFPNQMLPEIEACRVEENYLGDGRRAVIFESDRIFQGPLPDGAGLYAQLKVKANPSIVDSKPTFHVYTAWDNPDDIPADMTKDGYGRYEYHSEIDTVDIDKDGNKTEIYHHREIPFQVDMGTGVFLRKSVGTEKWAMDSDYKSYLLDQPFMYRVMLSNRVPGKVIETLTLTDVLPYPGDKTIIPDANGALGDRGSNVHVLLSGPIEDPSEKLEIQYLHPQKSWQTEAQMKANGLKYQDVTQVKATLKPGESIVYTESVEFFMPVMFEQNLGLSNFLGNNSLLGRNSVAADYTLSGGARERIESAAIETRIRVLHFTTQMFKDLEGNGKASGRDLYGGNMAWLKSHGLRGMTQTLLDENEQVVQYNGQDVVVGMLGEDYPGYYALPIVKSGKYKVRISPDPVGWEKLDSPGMIMINPQDPDQIFFQNSFDHQTNLFTTSPFDAGVSSSQVIHVTHKTQSIQDNISYFSVAGYRPKRTDIKVNLKFEPSLTGAMPQLRLRLVRYTAGGVREVAKTSDGKVTDEFIARLITDTPEWKGLPVADNDGKLYSYVVEQEFVNPADAALWANVSALGNKYGVIEQKIADPSSAASHVVTVINRNLKAAVVPEPTATAPNPPRDYIDLNRPNESSTSAARPAGPVSPTKPPLPMTGEQRNAGLPILILGAALLLIVRSFRKRS